MMIHRTSPNTFDTAGFPVGGRPGVTATMTPWAQLMVAYGRFRARRQMHKFHTPETNAKLPQHAAYANITDVVDRLESIAKQGNWNLEKRLEIARMACEKPAVTFEQLEYGYDRGFRSVLDKARQNVPEHPANGKYDESVELGFARR